MPATPPATSPAHRASHSPRKAPIITVAIAASLQDKIAPDNAVSEMDAFGAPN